MTREITIGLRAALAAVGLVFVWFFVGAITDAESASDSSTQLLAVAAAGFITASIIFP